MLGKHHQDFFPSGRTHYAKAPLELIHRDPMSFLAQYFLGARYVLTFIDEFSERFGVSLMSQAILANPYKFLDAASILEWDMLMAEKYSSLMKNNG